MNSLRRNILFPVFLVVYIVISLISPGFSSFSVQFFLTGDIGILLMVSCGMLLLLMLDGLDLSVGALAGLCSLVGAWVITEGYSPAAVFPLLALIGIVAGSVNFLINYYLRLHSIVTSFLMLMILRGIASLLPVRQIELYESIFPSYDGGGIQPFQFFVSFLFWLPSLAFILSFVMRRFTYFPSAALTAGISSGQAVRHGLRPVLIRYLAWVSSSVCAAAAGLMFLLSTSSGSFGYGDDLELELIACAALSGFLFTRGDGNLLMFPFSALLLSLVKIFLIEADLSGPMNPVVLSGILVLLVLLIGSRRKQQEF